MVEGFVKAAATELPRGIRINCVSPTVLAESVAYHVFFPGFTPIPVAEVAQAYLRAIANPITGRILKLHRPTVDPRVTRSDCSQRQSRPIPKPTGTIRATFPAA